MNGEFHQTPMGRTFYERTMPAMVQQLTELTGSVNQLVDLIKQAVEAEKGREATKDKVKQDW